MLYNRGKKSTPRPRGPENSSCVPSVEYHSYALHKILVRQVMSLTRWVTPLKHPQCLHSSGNKVVIMRDECTSGFSCAWHSPPSLPTTNVMQPGRLDIGIPNKYFPFFHGTMEAPSCFFPSHWKRPGGRLPQLMLIPAWWCRLSKYARIDVPCWSGSWDHVCHGC